eukprot:6964425-Pyramimonas_sp.AAC.1
MSASKGAHKCARATRGRARSAEPERLCASILEPKKPGPKKLKQQKKLELTAQIPKAMERSLQELPPKLLCSVCLEGFNLPVRLAAAPIMLLVPSCLSAFALGRRLGLCKFDELATAPILRQIRKKIEETDCAWDFGGVCARALSNTIAMRQSVNCFRAC